ARSRSATRSTTGSRTRRTASTQPAVLLVDTPPGLKSGSARPLFPAKAGQRWRSETVGRQGYRSVSRRDDRGAVAVEFALLVPILVVILFAIIAVGIALFQVVNYTSAAREGARYAAVHCRPEAAVCTQDLIVGRVTQ